MNAIRLQIPVFMRFPIFFLHLTAVSYIGKKFSIGLLFSVRLGRALLIFRRNAGAEAFNVQVFRR